MLLYRAYHAQTTTRWPRMAQLGLAPGQPKLPSLTGPFTAQHLTHELPRSRGTTLPSRMLDLASAGLVRNFHHGQARAGPLRAPRPWSSWQRVIMRFTFWDSLRQRKQDQVMLAGLPAEERATLAALLERVHENLATASAPAPGGLPWHQQAAAPQRPTATPMRGAR